MDWVRILAYITGTVDQELLLRNEYLAAENRILKAQLKTPLRLTDAERMTLAEIAHRLGRKALEDVANVVKPDTLLGWYRRLIARKFDGSKSRRYPGRPRIDDEIEQWVVRMAQDNSDWGYDRIVGAMSNLGYRLSHQTVGNILQRHGIPPAPERKRTTTWADFIRVHMAVLAGTDFFSVEVLTWGRGAREGKERRGEPRLLPIRLRGLVTYYVLFFIRLESRRVEVAGITQHPNEAWMKQIARNVTMDEWGFLDNCSYLIHDRDTKYCQSFRDIVESGDVRTLPLPARSPNLNAFAERWVKSVKDECLSKLILFGEASLRRTLREYVVHYHVERNHQGKDNVLLFPVATKAMNHGDGSVGCKERLGGLLKYYHREAA